MIKKEKKYQSSDIFIFPPSSDGLETVRTVFDLMEVLAIKFRKAYKNRPDIRCEYEFTFPRFYTYIQGLEYVKLVAHCKFCSHKLVYFKNQSFEQEYKLIAFRNYHVHTKDPKKIREVFMKTARDAPRVYRDQPYYLKVLRVKHEKHDPSMTVEEYLKSLPIQCTMITRLRLAAERYGITETEFNAITRKINSEYEITLREFFHQCEENQFEYAYAPSNILEAERQHLLKMKSKHYALSFDPDLPSVQHYQPNQRSIHFVDTRNPHLPNILLIVTPRMKQLYHQFGQYVGFDLTFSIIRERPTQHKQFLVGILSGSTECKRILIYALVVTNSQTVEAYKHIFTEFFRLMGSCPSAVLTDEEKPIYYALKQLQKEGVFTGNHYFDMFHIMKKFRKSADGNCFQLYRKILNVSNKAEYRKIFRKLMREVNNDKELNLLRIFDNNSEKFCFSQIKPQFVGASISNSINQKFHDILKSNIPYQTKYIKVVKIMIRIATEMNDTKEPDIQMYPLEENLNIPFLKPYRTLLSRQAFKTLLREVARAGRHTLLTTQEENKFNLCLKKVEEGQKLSKVLLNINKKHYIVISDLGPFSVYKKSDPYQCQKGGGEGKWHCLCEFQQKSGILCSHIVKVLLHLKLDFMNNFHKRWLVKQQNMTNRILNFKYVGKFHTIRSNHRIRVRGYKGTCRNNLFGQFEKEYYSTNPRDLNDSEVQSADNKFLKDDTSGYENSEFQDSKSLFGQRMFGQKRQMEGKQDFSQVSVEQGIDAKRERQSPDSEHSNRFEDEYYTEQLQDF